MYIVIYQSLYNGNAGEIITNMNKIKVFSNLENAQNWSLDQIKDILLDIFQESYCDEDYENGDKYLETSEDSLIFYKKLCPSFDKFVEMFYSLYEKYQHGLSDITKILITIKEINFETEFTTLLEQ